MKKTRKLAFFVGIILVLACAFFGCDLEIRDEYEGNTVKYSGTGLIASGDVAAGTAFEADGAVDTSSGVSVSFNLPATYSDDWATVVETDNVTINLSTMAYDGTDIYEAAATYSLDSPTDAYKAFFSDACYVSISFNEDGSVVFYKNGTAALTYASSTKMNDNATTIADLCKAFLEDVETGFTIQFAVSNVYLDVGLTEDSALALYNANN